MTGTEVRAKYEAFLAAIDNSVARRDEAGCTLADFVNRLRQTPTTR